MPLAGTLPGDGFRLTVEVFIETGPRGRIATWSLDIRKSGADTSDATALADRRRSNPLSSVDGLHRLVLHPDKQFAAQNLVLRSVDFEVRLPAGQVFVAETPDGATALVLLGDGSIFFSPEAEGGTRPGAHLRRRRDARRRLHHGVRARQPVRRRRGRRRLDAHASPGRGPARVQACAAGLRRGDRNSFSLDLSDLSRDTWSLLPQPGDFVAEVRTRRYDKLTFARASSEPEDVSLFQRARKRNIALYASEQKLAVRGQFYDEDALVDYDVLDYAVDAAFSPEREWMEGRTRLRLRVRVVRARRHHAQARRLAHRQLASSARSSAG